MKVVRGEIEANEVETLAVACPASLGQAVGTDTLKTAPFCNWANAAILGAAFSNSVATFRFLLATESPSRYKPRVTADATSILAFVNTTRT